MDNMHLPPGGDPQDYWPTQELGATAGPAGQAGPPGQAGQAGGGPSGPGGPSGRRPRRGRVLWWSAGLALVALLAGGAALAASGSGSPSSSGPTGQAAVLNSMLSSASSPGADGVAGHAATAASPTAAPCVNRAAKLKAAGHPYAARVARYRCHHPLRRARALGGIHGEFTFETKSGTRTIAYERGVIQSISGSDVVVQAKDGTTWTWVLGSSTVVRENGQKTSPSTLADGQSVFAGGPVVSGAYDARLIVIRTSSGHPSPSPPSSPAAGS